MNMIFRMGEYLQISGNAGYNEIIIACIYIMCYIEKRFLLSHFRQGEGLCQFRR